MNIEEIDKAIKEGKIIIALFRRVGASEIFEPTGVCMNGKTIQINVSEESDRGQFNRDYERCLKQGEEYQRTGDIRAFYRRT